MKDFYKILGVSENASEEEIKSAYKKLAKQHHPDKNQGNKKSEDKFKEMSEAYNLLGDAKKRKEYDQMRRFGGGRGFSGQGNHSSQDVNDLFKNFGFGGRQQGGGSFNDLFEELFNGGNAQPQERTLELTIPFEKSISGGEVSFQVQSQSMRINVPAGVADGEQMRIQHPSMGNFLITIRISPDKTFVRKGNDIYCELNVNFLQAVSGGVVRVSTVYGNKVEVKISAGTPGGTMLKLNGLGVKTSQGTGNMVVTVAIQVPKNLSKKQKELLDEFARNMNW